MKKILMTAACAAALFSVGANAAEIKRTFANPKSPILTSVTIPAGSEIVMLSGVSAPPIDPSKPATSFEAYGDTKTQTIAALNVAKKNLEALGYSMSDVVRVMAYVGGDPKMGGKMDFAGMNEGYMQFFNGNSRTARTTVQIAAFGVPYFLVEFEITAAKAPK